MSCCTSSVGANGGPIPSSATPPIDPDSIETAAGGASDPAYDYIPPVPQPPAADADAEGISDSNDAGSTSGGGASSSDSSAVADSREAVENLPTTPPAPGSNGAASTSESGGSDTQATTEAWSNGVEERLRQASVPEADIAELREGALRGDYSPEALDAIVEYVESSPLLDPATGQPLDPELASNTPGEQVAGGSAEGGGPAVAVESGAAGPVDAAAYEDVARSGDLGVDPTGGGNAAAGAGSTSEVATSGQQAVEGPGTPAWEAELSKLVTLMPSLGLTPEEAEMQTAQLRSSGMSAADLQAVITEAESVLAQDESAGAGTSTYIPGAAEGVASTPAWDEATAAKFKERLEKIDQLAPEMKEQYLQTMAMSGKSAEELDAEFERLGGFMPGWNGELKAKFSALDIDEKLLDDFLKQMSSGPGQTVIDTKTATKEQLDTIFDSMVTARQEARENGRLDDLKGADANASEMWNGILGFKDTKKEDFEKYVDSVKSAHVPGWRRVASIAFNFVPGAGLVNWIAGKDVITGEKMDRGNIFNIGMAVLSVLPAASWAKGAVSGMKGVAAIKALDTAVDIGKAAKGIDAAADVGKGAATLSGVVNAAEGGVTASQLANTALKGTELAGRVAKYSKWDVLKSSLPILSRFGKTGEIASDLKNVTQITKLAGQHAEVLGKLTPELAKHLDTVAVFEKTGAVAGSGLTRTALMSNADEIVKATGFKASELMQVSNFLDDGAKISQSGAVWRFNPVANTAGVKLAGETGEAAATSGGGIVSRLRGAVSNRASAITGRIAPQAEEGALVLGRGANLGTRAGYIQAAGALDAGTDGVNAMVRTTEIAERAAHGIAPATGVRRLAQIPRHFLQAGGGSQGNLERTMSAVHDARKAEKLLDAVEGSRRFGVVTNGTASGLPQTLAWNLANRSAAKIGAATGLGYATMRSGFPQSQITPQMNAADAQVAATEAQMRAAGIDPDAPAAGDMTAEEEAMIAAEEARLAEEQTAASAGATASGQTTGTDPYATAAA